MKVSIDLAQTSSTNRGVALGGVNIFLCTVCACVMWFNVYRGVRVEIVGVNVKHSGRTSTVKGQKKRFVQKKIRDIAMCDVFLSS